MYCAKCGAAVIEGAPFCQACGQPTGAAPAPGSVSSAAAGFRPASPYAGFWLRLVAYLIDGVVLGIPFGAIILVVLAASGALGALRSMNNVDSGMAAAVALSAMGVALGTAALAIVGCWLYYGLMESSSWQATLGKRALGLYVTDLDGRRISFGRASGRFFAKIITGLIPLFIGYIMAGFTEKKQALHDMIAGCLVLRNV
jgi:uncharacterized RDD family membrane protein YckC